MKIVWGRSIGWNIDLWSIKKLTNPMEYTIIDDGCDCYPWRETFIWWPTKTVTGKMIWGIKAFKRKVWVVWGTGFHMEPLTQYATIFEVISYDGKALGK